MQNLNNYISDDIASSAIFLTHPNRFSTNRNGAPFDEQRCMFSSQIDRQTFQIIGAAMEVHRRMQRGLVEAFYCSALSVEFTLRDIPFEMQYPIQLEYKGQRLRGVHHIDFVCFGSVVVEAKAISALTSADEAQLLTYLAMTRMKRGLLINFGSKSLEYKRRVMGVAS